MRLRLEAEPDEILAKGEQLIGALAQALDVAHPDLADRLRKAAAGEPIALQPEMRHPVLEQLRVRFRDAYGRQMQAMVRDIGRVLDQSTREVVKSEALAKGGKSQPRDGNGKWTGGDGSRRRGRSGKGGQTEAADVVHRGTEVVGTTQSGKPIHDTWHESNRIADHDNGAQLMAQQHPAYTAQDHHDAAAAHRAHEAVHDARELALPKGLDRERAKHRAVAHDWVAHYHSLAAAVKAPTEEK